MSLSHMKLSIKILILILLNYNINARMIPPRAPFHKRLNYKFNLFYKQQKEMIIITKKTILEKTIELVKDDLINDTLYVAKIYNIVNDHDKATMYIFIYEFISVMRKTKSDIEKFIPLYSINIMTYILIKTMLINNVIHNIHI